MYNPNYIYNYINQKNNYGNTALIEACKYNNIKIVEILLKYDCDIHIKNKKLITALNIANNNNYTEIVEILNKTETSLLKGFIPFASLFEEENHQSEKFYSISPVSLISIPSPKKSYSFDIIPPLSSSLPFM